MQKKKLLKLFQNNFTQKFLEMYGHLLSTKKQLTMEVSKFSKLSFNFCQHSYGISKLQGPQVF